MNNKDARFFGKAMALSTVIVVVYGLAVTYFIEDASRRGTFGDMFGGINALFTGLAFAGLVYTILQQKNQLEMQREDLALQRKELADTRKEFEEQNKTMSLQRFENTFFQMLSFNRNVFNQLNQSLGPNNLNEKGFAVLESSLRAKLSSAKNVADKMKRVRAAYEKFYMSRDNPLDGYFRGLNSIFGLVDKSNILSAEDKIFYVSLLSSQLSTGELFIIFFHSLAYGDRSVLASTDANVREYKLSLYIRKYNLVDFSRHPVVQEYYDLYEDILSKQ